MYLLDSLSKHQGGRSGCDYGGGILLGGSDKRGETMSLSRQERRRMAREAEKRSAFEQRYGRQIEERQNNVDDRVVELYTTCMGLAVTDLYGNMPGRVKRIVTRFCERLMSLNEPGVDYNSLQRELDEKTGIKFVWKKQ
jgi:hypothetical protein